MELLLLIDGDRIVTFCSGSLSVIPGLRPDQVLGRGLQELLDRGLSPAFSLDSLNSVMKLVRASGERARSVEISSATPVPRNYLVTVFPSSTAQNSTTTGITIKDCTGAREMEARRGKFLSTLSYELRDPVTALMGFTRLLLDSPSIDGDQRYWLENVQICGQRLAAIARDMLDVAAHRSGDLRRELEEAKLNEAIGDGSP